MSGDLELGQLGRSGVPGQMASGSSAPSVAGSPWDDIPDGGSDPLQRSPAPPETRESTQAGSGAAGGRLPHQPALDGLRGLAVAAVVLYHGAAADRIEWLEPYTKGGYLGVSAFFTLSGFLICSLLLTERSRSGAVSLRAFWRRRARRLLPAVLLLLGAVVVLTPLVGTASQLDHLPGDVWSSLFYVTNWHFVLEGSDYASQFSGAPSPLRHLWSLSVEEQWYLLVPLAALGVAALRRRRVLFASRRSLAWALLAASLAGTAWLAWISGGGWDNRSYMGTDTRLAEMGIGALAAALLAPGLRVPGRLAQIARAAAPVLILGLLTAWALVPIDSPWLFRGGLPLHALAVALLMVAAVQSSGFARRLLAVGWLTALGRISYGVYLFHWPILWWLTPERAHLPPTATLALQIALTLLVAWLSFQLLESPIRHRGALRGGRGARVGVAAVVAVAVAVAVLPRAERSELLAIGETPELVVPTTVATVPAAASENPGTAEAVAPPPPPLKVMVVGDSFAESIVFGLQGWGLLTGKAAVMNKTVAGCPFGRGGRNRGIGINRKPPPECDRRDEDLVTALAEFDPEVVFVAGGLWDVTQRRPPGFGRWTHIGEEDYDWYLTGELSHLVDVLGSRGALIVWANSPHWEPVPGSVIFMGRPPYPESDPARVDRFNEILATTVDPRPEAMVFDLAGWMSSQPGGELDRSLRFDGVHFTEESTGRLAAWLGPQLLSLAGR